jgi:hypothetical protein
MDNVERSFIIVVMTGLFVMVASISWLTYL